MTSGEITTIISALTVAIVTIIGRWQTGEQVLENTAITRSAAKKAEDKLNVIHELTNSNLAAVMADLALANDRIAKLEALLLAVSDGGKQLNGP